MGGFRERVARAMSGRYGIDQLSQLYLGLAVACLFLHVFTRSALANLAGMLLMAYCLYRTYSKNISKMSAQNQKFLTWRYRKIARYNQAKKHWAQRKEYCFFKCPDCKQKVRVPRGRGKIAITCPKCKTEFIKKS